MSLLKLHRLLDLQLKYACKIARSLAYRTIRARLPKTRIRAFSLPLNCLRRL